MWRCAGARSDASVGLRRPAIIDEVLADRQSSAHDGLPDSRSLGITEQELFKRRRSEI